MSEETAQNSEDKDVPQTADEGAAQAPPMNRAERRAAARKGGGAATPHHNTARPGGTPGPGQRGPGGMPPGKKAGLPRRTGKG